MNKKKLISIVLAGVIIAIGCVVYATMKPTSYNQIQKDGSASTPITSNDVRFLERQNLGYPFWIVEAKGYFEQTNFDRSLQRINPDTNTDFSLWVRENMDVGILSLDELLKIEEKYPSSLRAIFFIYDTDTEYSSNIVVKKGSNITTVKSLSGKRLAVETDIEKFLLRNYLEANSITDYQISKILRQDHGKQLETNLIDASWTTEPYASKLVVDGIGEVLTKNPNNNPASDVSQAPYGVIVVNNDYYNREPVIVDSLVKSLKMALEVTETEQRKIMKDHLGESWAQIVTNRTFAKISTTEDINKPLLQQLADKMYENGFTETRVETANLF